MSKNIEIDSFNISEHRPNTEITNTNMNTLLTLNLLFIYDENVIMKIKIKMTAASRRHEVHNARSSSKCLTRALSE